MDGVGSLHNFLYSKSLAKAFKLEDFEIYREILADSSLHTREQDQDLPEAGGSLIHLSNWETSCMLNSMSNRLATLIRRWFKATTQERTVQTPEPTIEDAGVDSHGTTLKQTFLAASPISIEETN